MQSEGSSLEPLLTPSDVADRLGIHRSTLYSMWRRGDGPPYVQVGAGLRRCRQADVDAFAKTVADLLTTKTDRH